MNLTDRCYFTVPVEMLANKPGGLHVLCAPFRQLHPKNEEIMGAGYMSTPLRRSPPLAHPIPWVQPGWPPALILRASSEAAAECASNRTANFFLGRTNPNIDLNSLNLKKANLCPAKRAAYKGLGASLFFAGPPAAPPPCPNYSRPVQSDQVSFSSYHSLTNY